jgi:predicted XRE-type DNA-binding protein
MTGFRPVNHFARFLKTILDKEDMVSYIGGMMIFLLPIFSFLLLIMLSHPSASVPIGDRRGIARQRKTDTVAFWQGFRSIAQKGPHQPFLRNGPPSKGERKRLRKILEDGGLFCINVGVGDGPVMPINPRFGTLNFGRNKMAKLPAFEKSSGNVFRNLGLPNADGLLLKAGIVSEIARLMKQKKLTQAKAITLTGTAQPDLSNLLRDKFRGFPIERLMLMLATFGRDVDVVGRPASQSRKMGGIRFKRAAA